MKYFRFLVFCFWLLSFSCAFQVLARQEKQNSQLRKPNNGVYVVAHRGAHNGIPENSLAAYQKAIDLGCDFIEIDVRTTKDGRFVSIHNSTVNEYVTGSDGKVSELSLSEIKLLDIGSSVGQEWKNTRVPSFEEILQLCHGKIGIYLDLKSANVTGLVEIIKKFGMERDILWYIPASYIKEIRELKSSCPYCIPMPDPGPKSNIEAVLSQVQPWMIATDMGEIDEEFVKTAHRFNAMVTVDEKEGTEIEWTQIINWKTDGIQTDHPEELISFLKKRNRLR
jgi:glycerophosphoryl diester phosphodiesterase